MKVETSYQRGMQVMATSVQKLLDTEDAVHNPNFVLEQIALLLAPILEEE